MAERSFSRIVVVPGIMGSELRLRELGPNKTPINTLVWGEDLNVIWKTLAQKPNCLSSSDVTAGKVLRYLQGFPLPKRKPLYGPLLEHLKQVYNLQENIDLFAFGYDWRNCNFKSAAQLADLLRSKTQEDDRVVLLAHSMGGLVCRALLSNERFADIRPRISKLIQMGTPVLGSAKAFFSLKSHLKLSRPFDFMLWLRQKRSPRLYYDLYSSLSSCESIFQLMPPNDERIIFDEAGEHYSALDTRLWQKAVHELIAGANALHKMIQTVTNDGVYSIYGTDIATHRAYMIDDTMKVRAICSPWVNGDGTVSVASASTFTSATNRLVFSSIGHDDLPQSRQVWNALSSLL
jgi:lecithin:cholesterol acyltransferase